MHRFECVLSTVTFECRAPFLCVPFPFCRSNLSHTWVFFTVCYVKVSHCFACVLLTACDVSALRSVLYVFCLIVWYVSALRTVLRVLCKNSTYVSFLRTVLNVFCRLLRSSVAHRFYVFRSLFVALISPTHEFSSQFVTLRSRTVLHVFCWLLVTLVPCAVFCMCSV